MSDPTALRVWRQTSAQRLAGTPLSSAVSYDSDLKTLVIGDGITAGGRIIPLADGSVPFTGQKLDLRYTDDGAGGGPDFIGQRISLSPAANDVLSQWRAYGRDSAGNDDEYARVAAIINSPASAAEYGTLEFWAADNGTLRRHARIGNGIPLALRTAPGGQFLGLNNTSDVQIGQFSNDSVGLGIYSSPLSGFMAGFRFNTGEVYLGGPYGAEAFRAERQASAVNRTRAVGGTAAQPARWGTDGETNVNMRLELKGDASLLLGQGASNARPAMKSTAFGYSGSYRVLLLGSPSATYTTPDTGAVTISLGQEPSGVAGNSFSGDGREIIHRRVVNWTAPNAAGTNWMTSHQFDAALYHRFFTDGGEQVRIENGVGPNSYLRLQGGTAVAYVYAGGSPADVTLSMSSKGASPVDISTGNLGAHQVRIPHVAGADRHLLLAGANAGNPKIATSAGHLELDPAGSNTVIVTGMPTSSAGLPSGSLWNDSGTVKIVP